MRSQIKKYEEHESTKITAEETYFLKHLVENRWDELNDRVNNLQNEVLDEIMEQEMALTRLETENFDKINKKSLDKS